jgi:hypothetical protein
VGKVSIKLRKSKWIAFKACSKGFDEYHDRPDQLSGVLGKYLLDNKLLPTENHAAYSLRYSFQDRPLAGCRAGTNKYAYAANRCYI